MDNPILPAFAMGAVLGAFYWGTLWVLSRHVSRLRRPVLSVVASSAIRLGLLCAGLYVVSGQSWKGLLAALGGVIAVRMLAMSLVRREGAASIEKASDAVQS